jgi:hypothetical protein
MSYAAHHKDFGPHVAEPSARENTNHGAKAGFWQRLFMAVRNSRQRHADRELASFIQGRGGHLTDELERDLIRHMTASAHYWRMRL